MTDHPTDDPDPAEAARDAEPAPVGGAPDAGPTQGAEPAPSGAPQEAGATQDAERAGDADLSPAATASEAGSASQAPVTRRAGSRGDARHRRRLLGGVAWTVVVASAAVVVARLAHLDDVAIVVGVLALSPWVFVPALAAAVVGVGTRRPTLAVVAIAALVAPAWWTAQQWDPFASTAAPPPGWRRLRVLDANVTWTNPDMSGIAAAVARDRPDLVALQEVTPGDITALDATHVLDRYRFRLLAPDNQSAGMALWSDRPLVAASVWTDAGHPELRARVRVGAATLSVLVVHTFIPVLLPLGQWKAELRGIAAAARHLTGPRLVVGDLNATWDMYELGDILRAGQLRDAAVATGNGWRPTWSPVTWLPPLIQLDHALVSSGVAVTGYVLRPVAGAQHRSLTIGLSVRPSG